MTIRTLEVKTSTRVASSIALSVCVSLGLFYFMSQLISGGTNLKKSDDTENFIEFVRIKRPSNTETKKRQLPKKPNHKNKIFLKNHSMLLRTM